MRNFLLAAAAFVALSSMTSAAMADHFRHRHVHSHGYGVHYVTPHRVYRQPVVVVSPAYVYPAPYIRPSHHYHYAYPGYSSFGVQGRNFSFYLGY